MEFRILGPLEVWEEGRAIGIAAPKQRALLACLLLSANRVVSADRLIDDLWGEHPPSRAARALHFHVSHLRDALRPGRSRGEEGPIVTRPPGYLLVVDPDCVDAARFERLVGAASEALSRDPERAATALGEALDLWHGPALSEFADEPFAAADARRLEELRLTALEDRIEADLACGRHETLVAELEKLTGEHPFRERLWAQLMVALYRSSRQAEALRAFQDLRRRLGGELGIEPSLELQALEQRILDQDPELREGGPLLSRGGSLRGFQLEGCLGEGSLGVVWRASQPSIGRTVAVKVIKPRYSNRPGFVRRFEAEARLIASLEHPHITPVFDFWRDPHGAYLVMPLMAGGGLDRAATGGWEPTRVLRLAEQIGSALAYAHRLGLSHGDLHPGNVLLDAEGHAYLSDFGLARLTEEASMSPPAYVSPERRDGGAAGPASDLFGFGCLVYRAFAGADPLPGHPSTLSALRPDVPAALDRILARATDPDPAARFADVDHFVGALREALGAVRSVPAVEAHNPYKGLRAFSEADRGDFFGRSELTSELATAVAEHRMVAVVGPSGCGKSSVVRAGLIPALRRGGAPGSERWLITDLYPGADPFARLTDALLRVAVAAPADLGDRVCEPARLTSVLAEVLPPGADLVVLVDQLEELFTLCPDPALRVRFLDALCRLATEPVTRTRVVVTLRADHLGEALAYRPFGELLHAGMVSITTPGPGRLAEAIDGPARRAGVEAEADLVAAVVEEVADQPGGLPLMEYTLTQLFEAASGGPLTLEAYRRLGGVAGSLGRWPEQVVAGMDATAHEAVRRIFLRLVSIDESGRPTRRRVPVTELHELGDAPELVDRVLGAFGAERLLTFDRHPHSRTPTVEIAHDALLERWERLQRWVTDRHDQLVMERRFRAAHDEWVAADRWPEHLLEGARLAQFAAWAQSTDLALPASESDFLRASRAAHTSRLSRRRRIRTAVVALLATLTVTAGLAAIVATTQRDRAERQQAAAEEQATLAAWQQARAEEQAAVAREEADRADVQERIARGRSLAASSTAALDRDPELAVLLAIEAVETTRAADGSVLREAEEALHRAVAADRLVAVAPVEMYGRSVTFTPRGDRLVVAGFLTSQVVAVPSGEVLQELPFPIAVVEVVGDSHQWLAVADFDGGLTVRDAATFEEVFRLTGHSGWITDLAVDAEGKVLASISPYDGSLRVWDLTGRVQVAEFALECPAGSCPGGVALTPDGRQVTSGTTIWDLATGRATSLPITATSNDVEIAGDRIIVGDGIVARVIDLRTGVVEATLSGHTANLTSITLGAGGTRVVTAGREGTVRVWQLEEAGPEEVLVLPAHSTPAWVTALSPDGRYLASLGGIVDFPRDVVESWPTTWEMRLFDIGVGGSREWATVPATPRDLAFTPDGAAVLATGPESGATLWDAATGALIAHYPQEGETRAGAVSPDGTLVVLAGTVPGEGSELGWAVVIDTATGATIRELIPPSPGLHPNDVAFSADGALVAVGAGTEARVWETASWETAFSLTDPAAAEPFGALAFSPGGDRIATQWSLPEGSSAPVTIWDTGSRQLVGWAGQFPRLGRGAVAFSPDGRLLLTAGQGRPTLWEAYTARELGELAVTASEAGGAAFSSDGARIATAESDGTIHLWDGATTEELLVLSGHTAEAVGVAFSPDGSRLASLSLDGTLRIWTNDLEDLLRMARSRLTRNLTDAECRAYVAEGCPPAPALERLVPALGELTGPVGIGEDAWLAAEPGGTWRVLTDGGHPGLAAYDEQSDRVVSLQEFDDRLAVSILDPATARWSPGSAVPGKPVEDNAYLTVGGAAYHPGLDRVMVLRTDDGATVAYDVEADTWAEVVPGGPFAGWYGVGIAYDSGSGQLVLFGGAEWGRMEEGKHVGLDETWIYDASAGGDWTRGTSTVRPPGRVNHGMAYDAESDKVIVFGGATVFAGEVLGDTWAYDADSDTWTQMNPTVSPPARAGHAMWYDPTADLVFLFGGSGDWSSWPPLPWLMFGGEELWAYDYNTDTWTLYRASPNPDYQLHPAAAFRKASGEAILFGGSHYDAERRYQGSDPRVWAYRHPAG